MTGLMKDLTDLISDTADSPPPPLAVAHPLSYKEIFIAHRAHPTCMVCIQVAQDKLQRRRMCQLYSGLL